MLARTLLPALVTLAAAIPGCGDDAIKLIASGSDTIIYVARTHPSPGTLDEAAIAFGQTLNDELTIATALDRIATSEDPYGEAIATAVCTGLARVAEQSEDDDAQPPSTQSWEDFLVDQLTSDFGPIATIRSKVALFNNAARLAEINPQAAVRYVQVCHSR
jgi:hypothetical protein